MLSYVKKSYKILSYKKNKHMTIINLIMIWSGHFISTKQE